LDYAAATPVLPEVERAMRPYYGKSFGNPGSLHGLGQEAISAVDKSRATVAQALGASFREIIFTSSATEANNLAIAGSVKGLVGHASSKSEHPPRIVIFALEHESVSEAANDLEKEGVEVVRIPAMEDGTADLKKLKAALSPSTVLVSVMYAQNEAGTLQPLRKIADIIAEFKARMKQRSMLCPLFHTDAAQAFQFLPSKVKDLGVDLLTLSSQKIYGPKGAGALYVRDEVRRFLHPLILGGGQEYGLRSGTENVPAIVGFAKAVEITEKVREAEAVRIRKLTRLLWQGLKRLEPSAALNVRNRTSARDVLKEGLPNILSVYFPKRDSAALLVSLDLAGVMVSAGSACGARANRISPTIKELYSAKRAKSTIRMSLGRPTTEEEIKRTLKVFKKILKNEHK